MNDDTIYVTLLILSIPMGYLFKSNRFIQTPKFRSYVSSLIGFVMVLITCSYDSLHSIVVTLVNSILLIAVNPKYVPIFSFVWCFGYLLFFWTTHLFGLPKPLPYANAVQLVMTLKVKL